MVEILAEYRRLGVRPAQIGRALSHFSPLFLAGELVRRKARFRRDLRSSADEARRMGWRRMDEMVGKIPLYQCMGLSDQ